MASEPKATKRWTRILSRLSRLFRSSTSSQTTNIPDNVVPLSANTQLDQCNPIPNNAPAAQIRPSQNSGCFESLQDQLEYQRSFFSSSQQAQQALNSPSSSLQPTLGCESSTSVRTTLEADSNLGGPQSIYSAITTQVRPRHDVEEFDQDLAALRATNAAQEASVANIHHALELPEQNLNEVTGDEESARKLACDQAPSQVQKVGQQPKCTLGAPVGHTPQQTYSESPGQSSEQSVAHKVMHEGTCAKSRPSYAERKRYSKALVRNWVQSSLSINARGSEWRQQPRMPFQQITPVRHDPIRQLSMLQRYRATFSADIVFLVDCSGSMEAVLPETKRIINEVITKFRQETNISADAIRFAFVPYCDYWDTSSCTEHQQSTTSDNTAQPVNRQDELFKVVDFGASAVEVQQRIQQQQVEPQKLPDIGCIANDQAEDVLTGLERCTKLSWSHSSNKLLCHLADAPCHGREFHPDDDSVLDYFPNGDVYGRSMREQLLCLRDDLGVTRYFFMHVGDKPECTRAMIQRFRQLIADNPADSNPWLEDAACSVRSIFDNVLAAFRRTASSTQQVLQHSVRSMRSGSSRVQNGGKLEADKPWLDYFPPGWESRRINPRIRRYHQVRLWQCCTQDLMSVRSVNRVITQQAGMLELEHVADIALTHVVNYYASGTQRSAHFADIQLIASNGEEAEAAIKGNCWIVKQFLDGRNELDRMRRFQETLAVAQITADQFNQGW